MPAPSALIFDFDGTLIDTESVELASLQRMWRAHGRTLEADRWAALLGLEAPDWVAILADELAGPVDHAKLRAALRVDQAEQTARQPLRPGTRELLDLADQHNIRLAISSNADRRRVNQALAYKGLSGAFEVVVAREDVDLGKPAPDSYLKACSLLNVRSTECIAFEDSEPGLASALAAGLRCVAVPTSFTAAHDFTAAHLVLTDLSQLSRSDLVAGRLRSVDG